MTSDLEKIEEIFLDQTPEEESEAPVELPPNAYLQQFQKGTTSRKTMFRNNNTTTTTNANTSSSSSKTGGNQMHTQSSAPSAPMPPPSQTAYHQSERALPPQQQPQQLQAPQSQPQQGGAPGAGGPSQNSSIPKKRFSFWTSFFSSLYLSSPSLLLSGIQARSR